MNKMRFQMGQSSFTILITCFFTYIVTYAESTTNFLIVYDGGYFKDQINTMNFTLLTSRTQVVWEVVEMPQNKTLYKFLSQEFLIRKTFNNNTNNKQVVFIFADNANLLSRFFGNSLILNYGTSIAQLVRRISESLFILFSC